MPSQAWLAVECNSVPSPPENFCSLGRFPSDISILAEDSAPQQEHLLGPLRERHSLPSPPKLGATTASGGASLLQPVAAQCGYTCPDIDGKARSCLAARGVLLSEGLPPPALRPLPEARNHPCNLLPPGSNAAGYIGLLRPPRQRPGDFYVVTGRHHANQWS